jgi:hypothetical protein
MRRDTADWVTQSITAALEMLPMDATFTKVLRRVKSIVFPCVVGVMRVTHDCYENVSLQVMTKRAI